jgi:peptidoglycan L-alanyl-D-glutamate endopeptidase CwlK
MNKFSKKSQERLATCHPDLQKIFNKVIEHYDCTIVCGHREKEDQDEAVRTGASKLAWPNSKHNSLPSRAVDVVPFPVDWADTSRMYHFAGYVYAVADYYGIKLRWGGDFNGDFKFLDEKFKDLPHWELVGDNV